jgi:hypothetical protein
MKGGVRKEVAGNITLDLSNPEFPSIKLTSVNSNNATYKYSENEIDTKNSPNDPYTDYGQPILAFIHVHPNSAADGAAQNVAGNFIDAGNATARGQIIYTLYGKSNGDHIDRHNPDPTKSRDNITSSTNAVQLARDAIESFAGRR